MISLMRNIKYDTDETTHKREKESQTQRIDWIAKGEGGGRGVNREFGFSGCHLVCVCVCVWRVTEWEKTIISPNKKWSAVLTYINITTSL